MKEILKLNFRNKVIRKKSCIICDSFFSKLRGLMFRSRNFKTPLLFIFNKPGIYPIHSFFCRKFRAVWMKKGRIIDEKIVQPWTLSVTPKEKFDELLEIPILPSDKERFK